MDVYILLMKLIALIIGWFVWDWLIDWVFTQLDEWFSRGRDGGTGSGADDGTGGMS